MPFLALPAEIQIQIFSYLDNPTLKAARKACRAFRDNAEPTLFRYVIAAARYQTLGAFQKVSLFEVFQKHVNEIIFDGTLYNRTLAKIETLYHRQSARVPNLDQGFTYHKHGRWKRYAQLCKEQEEMKIDGVLFQTLVRALEWMPNISRITYSPHPRHLPAEYKETQDLVPRGIATTPDDAHTTSNHPFCSLIAALYASQFTGIRELRTEPIGKKPGMQFALSIFELDDDEMTAAKFLFEHLEKLVLWMSLWMADDSMPDEISENFATLLASSANLQYLSFHPLDWQPRPSAQSLFNTLGLQATWPKLQHLQLGGVHADESDFNGMIKRHKKTLTSVIFRECTIFRGFWADIVDEVLYGTHVQQFRLDGVHQRTLLSLDYTTLSTLEKEEWLHEGTLEIAEDGERNFVEYNPRKKSVYDARKQQSGST